MKCSNCGMELSPASAKCVRCGKTVSGEPGFRNMEKELLDTVLEEENLSGLTANHELQYGASEEARQLKKHPGRLAAALVAGAALFAGVVFALQSMPTGYAYAQTEEAYQECLAMLAQENYRGAAALAEELVAKDADNLEYLSLLNTICDKTKDQKVQTKTLQQIIALDEDNYPAYEKLLALYLEDNNQAGIEQLAAGAPNSAIVSMLSDYLVDTPVLGLTPGVYEESQWLEIDSDEGLNIYYTLDGSAPQEYGRLYMNPVELTQGHITVRAVCRNEKGTYGEEITGEYQIGDVSDYGDGTAVEQPAVYPDGGQYSSPQMITIDVPIGCKAYYSWDAGMELTPENGTLYTGGITMPQGDTTLSVILTDTYGNASSVKQVSYSYQPNM